VIYKFKTEKNEKLKVKIAKITFYKPGTSPRNLSKEYRLEFNKVVENTRIFAG